MHSQVTAGKRAADNEALKARTEAATSAATAAAADERLRVLRTVSTQADVQA